ncbi:centromere protein L-like isoform X1 [Athalia rosae]|uniref:centromere protein L-like isoform X1 n=1 Tax=Athalia rosae TaxID=37344 RepID=UPI0006264D83|nr:centromere protein L-like isoform X1 [Athalia rosae]XP_048508407.1 centromere protein L-like isoform X1 [Athalia rosae]
MASTSASGLIKTYSTLFNTHTPGHNPHRTYFEIQSRQSPRAAENDSDDADDNLDEALDDLITKTWDVWAASPLYGMKWNEEVKLKQYAKRLRENVATSLCKEDVSYDAEFLILKDLVRSRSHQPAIKVLVYSNKDDSEKENCIYTGIFLSWGSELDSEQENLKLPIVLTRGGQTVTQAIHVILCQMFDCVITAMPASQEDLMWLTAVILNSSNPSDLSVQRKKKQVTSADALTLEYRIPGLPTSDLILVQFPISCMIALWFKICPTQQSLTNPREQIESRVYLEQIEKFNQFIRLQLLNNMDLELGYCLLSKISLPSLTIKANKIKCKNIDTLDRVLWYFQEKALLYMAFLTQMNIDEAE